MKKQRSWVIRGFDVDYIEDDESGLTDSISTLQGFREEVSPSFLNMMDLLKSPKFSRIMRKVHDGPKDDTPEFYTMRIKITFNKSLEYEVLRANKHGLIECVKKWAEKRTARYNMLTGWRLNAIKDPIFAKKNSGNYQMTFDVLLSHVIWFSGNKATASAIASDPIYAHADVTTLISLIEHELPNIEVYGIRYKINVV